MKQRYRFRKNPLVIKDLTKREKESLRIIGKAIQEMVENFKKPILDFKNFNNLSPKYNLIIPPLETIEPEYSIPIPSEIEHHRHKFPFKLNENIKWEHITIKFNNGHDVTIHIKGMTGSFNTNYEEMGFCNETTGLPRKCWTILEGLSLNNGNICWGNDVADLKIKKRKQEIKEFLCSYFGIEEDPFYLYSKREGYQLKIQLIAEKDN